MTKDKGEISVVCKEINDLPDANKLQVQIHDCLKQFRDGIFVGTKLGAEWARGVGIVREEAKDELRVWVKTGNLVQFVSVVERHGANRDTLCIAQLRRCFARVGKNDVLHWSAHFKAELNLGLAGAVESGSAGNEGPDNGTVRVALDSWTQKESKRGRVSKRV